jgi:hypothetical protein
MKRIIIGLVGAVLTLTAITSCKKLDLVPYSAIDIETGFKTLQDAKYWNTGLYSAFRGRQYGTFNTLQETQADQLNASLDFGNRGGAAHRWGSFLQANDVAGPYQSYYSGLSNVNVMIKGFETITVTAGAQTDSLNTYKADARLARAFYLNELAVRYAKPYNPTTAATDLAVPLITEFDVLAKPVRATVKAVYDQIIADINYAKTNNKRANVRGARYFTPDAVLALEARVRLNMQDWAGAYTAANTLISSGRYPLYTTATALKTYWTNDATQEDIMRINATLTETVNTNAIYLGFVGAANYYVPDFIPTQTVVDSYEATDFRKNIYFEQKLIQIQGVKYPNVWLVNKFAGNPALFTTTFTNYQQANKVFRIGEIYAIAAEAAERSGNAANALAALNALKVARGATASAAAGAALTQEVREERTREMNFDGFRLWDLKRWGLGVTRGTPQSTVFINNGTGFSGLSVPASDPKFVWGLPTNDILLNSNLVQNPGW